MERYDLLHTVLSELDKAGILNRVVLVGSWCQDFYRKQFGNPMTIPASRTLDADILIPRDIKVDHPIDISSFLEKCDFVVHTDYRSGLQRFTHPLLDVEFLTTAPAGPKESIHHFKNLGLTAQELRFMSIPLMYNYQVTYRELTITIPEPEAYTLHKLIVSERRAKATKAAKDLQAATGLLAYFEKHPQHVSRLNKIYSALPKRWQRRIQSTISKAGVSLPTTASR